MMNTSFKALALTALILAPTASAFAPQRAINRNVLSTRLNAATVGGDFLAGAKKSLFPQAPKKTDDDENLGAMPDLTGIAFSGLKGKALSLKADDFPMSGEVRKVIPAECFEPDTVTSLSYLSVSVIGTVICTLFGVNALNILPPENLLTLPFWTAYSAITGTVAMGLWVLAHECGHGAFSKNITVRDTVGYIIHSIMLVPYYSWQRSHAVHHKFTNHMDLGETHVPEPIIEKNEGSYSFRSLFVEKLGKENGIRAWGALQGFLHLIIGWPAYLWIGATGGPARGMTNHYWPEPITTPPLPSKELFPGNWKEKVLKSDIGIGLMFGALGAWALCNGIPQVMALYGGPLIIINCWLVVYTWLQHTDVDVPHFDTDDHNFIKGAFHTIDRPYDKLDPWGLIDFLHHKIGTTHVAHHYDSSIPHYKAEVATNAIKENFPELYLYDPTPIPEALWRICKGCTAVEKRGDKYIWNNEGLEDSL